MQIRLRPYQINAIKQLKDNEINILSICPGGGKTITAIEYSKRFKKVLILAHGTNVLKNQWSDVLKEFKFKYSTNINSKEKYILTIPQSIYKKEIPEFDLIIVDEAHEFYFAPMVKKIIEKTNCKTQLLLTGTPSKFVRANYNPIIISGTEVYKSGVLANPTICAVSSSYYTEEYNQDFEVLNKIKEDYKKVSQSFENMIKEMLLKLNLPNKNVSKCFDKLDKTMIVCRNIKQAKHMGKILKKYKINYINSTSDDDLDSNNIKLFQKKSKIKVLLVVRRGILGFNFPDLINVVDFTGSRNIDRIYQLYARVLRKNGKDKYFFKLCYGENRDIDLLFLSAALCLNNKSFIEEYDGTNIYSMNIPSVSKTESNGKREVSDKKSNNININKNLIKEIADLKLLSDLENTNDKNEFKTIKYVKFSDVITKLTGKNFVTNWTYDSAKKFALSYTKYSEFQKTGHHVYEYARVNGFLNDITKHMEKVFRWNEDLVKKEALKYNKHVDFCKNSGGAFNWAKRNKIYSKITKHFKVTKRSWNKELVLKEALKYKTRKEFIEKNNNAYHWACTYGILQTVCKHMKHMRKKWDKNSVLKTALKYKNSLDMRKKEGQGPYNYALKNKILHKLKFKGT